MKYLCLVDQLQVQLLKGKLRIRPRLSGEAEGPVSSGVKGNKGQVVNTELSCRIPFVSIPASLRVFMSSPPKASVPTLPRNAVRSPYLLRAARKFPGAPPGFAFMVGYPAASVSLAAKSIRSSPMAVTSYMVNSPLCGRF